MNKDYLKKNWAELQFGSIAIILLLLAVWSGIIDVVWNVKILPFAFFPIGIGVLFTSGVVLVASVFLKK